LVIRKKRKRTERGGKKKNGRGSIWTKETSSVNARRWWSIICNTSEVNAVRAHAFEEQKKGGGGLGKSAGPMKLDIVVSESVCPRRDAKDFRRVGAEPRTLKTPSVKPPFDINGETLNNNGGKEKKE